jgi:hypothetical protein
MWQKIIDFFKNLFPSKKEEATAPAIPIKTEVPADPVVSNIPLLPISWDSTLGKDVSKFVYQTFLDNYDVFMSASDFDKIRSDYKILGKAQLATAFTEFISQIAKYESSWKPAAASVDVGSQSNKDTWSVGLMQMSQVDQKNYGLDLGFSYDDLKTAIPNLKLALAVMVKQIKKRGKIFIPTGESGVYWATIHPGGKYDKTKEITDVTQAMKLQQFSQVLKSVEPVKPSPIQKVFDYGAKMVAKVTSLLGMNEASAALQKILVPWWKRIGLPGFNTLVGGDHAWCALFLDWLINQVGLKGPGSAMAADTAKWGVRAGGDWFMAPFAIRHASGGFHTGFFLCWIDKSQGLAAVLSGNSGNIVCVRVYNLLGNKSGHDEIYGGLRWGKDWAPGYELTYAEMIARFPQLKAIGMDSNTR